MHKEKHQKVGKMGKHLWLVSILMMVFWVSDAVAAGVLVPASQFPNFANDEYMQPNTIYQNSALAVNMDGVYEGEVWANAVYTDGAICSPGTYLPANTVVCETCLEDNYCSGGTFAPSSDNQGIKHCSEDFGAPAGSTSSLDCHFTKALCAAGTYLPAFGTLCETCLANNFCPGGVYEYNYEEPQGLVPCRVGEVSAPGATGLEACRPWTIMCEAGTYLPADSRSCEICPENSYCGGDGRPRLYAYSLNDQGVESCPSDLVSPEGTTSVGGCGKIMHVGEDVLYLTSEQQTTPALAVKLEGKVYYAKMTPGEKAINEVTNTSLRTRVDGIEYSIHDNTTQEE